MLKVNSFVIYKTKIYTQNFSIEQEMFSILYKTYQELFWCEAFCLFVY